MAFLPLLEITLTANAMAKPKIFLTTNRISGIEIVDHGNIPGEVAAALNSSASGILQYVIAIRNTGPLSITGLDIRYEIDTNGNEVVKNFFYASPGDIASTSAIPIIAPGKTAIICPNHLVNEQIMSSGALSLTSKDILAIQNTMTLLDGSDQVKISVDSIIRSDGIIVGPDRSLRFRIFQRQISDYVAFRDELLTRLTEGESDADIILWLKQVANLKVMRLGKNGPSDRGVVLQKLLAQEYMELIKEGERQYCLRTLEETTPERKLHQIFRVRREVAQ